MTGTYYRRNKRHHTGFRSRCKTCDRQDRKQPLNRAKMQAVMRRWYLANTERSKANAMRWQHENRERRREISKKRYYRAVGLDQAIVKQMYVDQGGLCAYCEKPLEDFYHVDHMLPLSRGGTSAWDNLAITCPLCNNCKSAQTAVEFFMDRCL